MDPKKTSRQEPEVEEILGDPEHPHRRSAGEDSDELIVPVAYALWGIPPVRSGSAKFSARRAKSG